MALLPAQPVSATPDTPNPWAPRLPDLPHSPGSSITLGCPLPIRSPRPSRFPFSLVPTDYSPDQCPRPSANSKRQHPPSCHSSFNHLLLRCLFPSPSLPTLRAPMSYSGQSPRKGMSEQPAYCLQLTECGAEPCRGLGDCTTFQEELTRSGARPLSPRFSDQDGGL